MSRAILFTAFFVLMLTTPALAQTVYVIPAKTVLLSRPRAGAPHVAIVRKGQALTILKKLDRYYRVKTGRGIVGYIRRNLTQQHHATKPAGDLDQAGDLNQLLGILGGGGRSAAMDEEESSHAIRGLKKVDTESQSGLTGRQADLAVSAMENFRVGAGEVDRFQREGKVGAYAGR